MCSIFSPNFDVDHIQFSISIEEIANSIIETYDNNTAKIVAQTNPNDIEAYTLDSSAIQLNNLIFEKVKVSSKVLNYNVFHSSLLHLGIANQGDASNDSRYFHNDGPYNGPLYPWGIGGNQFPTRSNILLLHVQAKVIQG